MKLNIKELGAIKEGFIDLSKKLNVFSGPNGTGKTYMAYAIYGLLKNQIHVKTDEELVKKLVDKKEIDYEINFASLHKYREEVITNFKEDFDSLFGIGEDLAGQFFGETRIAFEDTKEEYEQTIVSCNFETTLTIRKSNIKLKKEGDSRKLKIEILDSIISNEDINGINFFLNSSILSFLSIYPISSTYILPVERNSIFTFNKELSISKQETILPSFL